MDRQRTGTITATPRSLTTMTFHNPELARLAGPGDYRTEDLARIEAALTEHGALTFERLPSGLFAASTAGHSIAASGYANVWVRDNIYVAFAHHVAGATAVAADVVQALIAYFFRYRHRFDDIIADATSAADPAKRPHVRFDGRTLSEIATERWAHSQNDALGYFLWLASRLAAAGAIAPTPEALSTLDRLIRYLAAIEYWTDADSGHWEERRKVSASSIGTVVAGLRAFISLAQDGGSTEWQQSIHPGLMKLAATLAASGLEALSTILPHECAEVSSRTNRRYDAALLFLIFPLEVIDDAAMVDLVLHDIERYLSGEHGIRRYLGDSYWAPDYDRRLSEADRTRDFSNDIETRDALLSRIGDEAQWCLFDPILSAYYGRRYLLTGDPAALEQQRHHLTRTLAQITADWRCAELYYLRQQVYVPNPHVPLQWTQANLLVALQAMRASLATGAIGQ